MSRGVVVDGHTVAAARDYIAILDNDGAKGTATATHALISQADGLAHKLSVCFCNHFACQF